MFQDGSQPPPTYSVGNGRPQQQGLLAIQVGHVARRARSQDTGSFGRPLQTAKTSSQAFGASPTVPTVTTCEDAPARQKTAINPGRHCCSAQDKALIALRLDPHEETSRKAAFTTIQFHVLLTLSSKFFSNFHHCTCPLSAWWLYLA